MKQFILLRDRAINLANISYVDFLDSGRAMIYLHGLPGEKAHVQLEVAEAARLKTLLEKEGTVLNSIPGPGPEIAPPLFPRRF